MLRITMRIRPTSLAAVFALVMPVCLFAEDAKPKPESPPEEKKEGKAAEKKDDKKPEADKPVVTEGTVTINGKGIAYEATAGTLPILKPDGKPSAQVFYTAYTMKGVKDVSARPVTFCFNGGPGSSRCGCTWGLSVRSGWICRRTDSRRRCRREGLVNNEFSLLDVTDLVFIDPVNTGFSRAEDPEEGGRVPRRAGGHPERGRVHPVVGHA
jgi:carboxypeptidase C (cathepsin A)